MNLNNAIAPRTQPASIKRRSGWRFALGFKVAAFSALSMFGMLGINQIALAASEKLPEKSYTMAPAAPERQTAQQAFAKTEGCMSCHTQPMSTPCMPTPVWCWAARIAMVVMPP